MDEWVHCNLCGQLLVKGISFFLTTCSHIFCERCKEKGTSPCAVCQNPCKVKELNEKLEANIQTYFCSIDQQLKKLAEVMKFQGQHRTLLFGHLKSKIEQQSKMIKSAENYFQKQSEEIKQLKYDQSILKRYINSYKAHSSGHGHRKPITPRQLNQNLVSPMNRRLYVQSPLVSNGCQIQQHASVGGGVRCLPSPAPGMMTPRQLAEIQNISADSSGRLSIRPRPVDGRMGEPSPRPPKRSASSHPSCINSPLVVSTDPLFVHQSKTNPKGIGEVWAAPFLQAKQPAKIWPTPPCTPRRISSSSGTRSVILPKVEPPPPLTPRHQPRPLTTRDTPSVKYGSTGAVNLR